MLTVSTCAQNQYDVIDLSDNDVKKLDGFSMVSRLSVVLMCNNSISRLGSHLDEQLPGLTALVLTNNKISHLSEVEKLQGCSKLEALSLLDNPVVHKQHYRLFTIFRIPSLKSLDYLKVSKMEREEAKKLFKSPAGAAFLASIKAEGMALQQQQQASQNKAAPMALTDSQKAQIKRAIERASTKDEVDLIELQLKVRKHLPPALSEFLPLTFVLRCHLATVCRLARLFSKPKRARRARRKARRRLIPNRTSFGNGFPSFSLQLASFALSISLLSRQEIFVKAKSEK